MCPDAIPVPFEELLRHRAWVQRLARTLVRDPGTADDLEQETWVAALERPPSRPHGVAGVRAWLGRVLRNQAIDGGRARARREAHEAEAAPRSVEPSAADSVARAETHRRVVDALMQLEEPLRTAVVLRFFESLPPREVARRTGVPTETARTRIRRGVERLRARLGADEGDRRGSALWAFAFSPPVVGAGSTGGGLGAAATKGGVMAVSAKQAVAVGLLVAAAVGGVAIESRRGPASAPVAGSPGTVARAEAELAGRGAPRAVAAPIIGADAGPAADARVPVRLVVRRQDGASVDGTSVSVESDGVVGAPRRVGEDGALEVEAIDRPRAAFVAAPNSALCRFVIPAAATRVELVIPAAAVVSGTVLVDGEAPTERLVLGLRASEPSVPAEVLPTPSPFDPWSLVVSTDARGAFRATGLPDDASVGFSAPSGFSVESPSVVRAPRDGVVVRLRRLPRLRGRIVRKGVPIPGASETVPWTDGASSGQVSTVADEAGRFTLVLEGGASRGTTLVVTDAQGLARAERELPATRGLDTDLGDVELADPWAAVMRLEVVGADGRPIVGAVAMIPGDPSWSSTPTGADGRLRLPAQLAGATALVAGLGHRVREVPIAPTGDEIARVVLEPTSVLRIHPVNTDGSLADAIVRVGGSGRVFDEPESHAALELREAVGGTHASSSVLADEGDLAVYRLADAAGDLVVPWVLPGRPLRIELADAYGETLSVTEVRLERGEARIVEVAASTPPRRLDGIVRDPRGLPVAGVRVFARMGSRARPDEAGGLPGPIVFARTDADGRFRFERVHGRTLDLFVAAPRLPPWARRSVPLPDGGHALEIGISGGRTLTVRPRSTTAPGLDVWAEPIDPDVWTPGYRPWSGTLRDDGSVRIEGVPTTAVEVVVRTAVGESRVLVPAGVSDVDVPLPKEK